MSRRRRGLPGVNYPPWSAGTRKQVPRRMPCMERAVGAAGFSPGDARGGAPCIRKLKISPFPAGEGGKGDRGQESKLKVGLAGGEEDKPPRRCLLGKVCKCRKRFSAGVPGAVAPGKKT